MHSSVRLSQDQSRETTSPNLQQVPASALSYSGGTENQLTRGTVQVRRLVRIWNGVKRTLSVPELAEEQVPHDAS